MSRRLELQAKLEAIASQSKVYYQPPKNVKITYPCIEYHVDGAKTKYADDRMYTFEKKYQVTVMDTSPDSPWIDKIMKSFRKCSYSRRYTSDGLYHDVFYLYY